MQILPRSKGYTLVEVLVGLLIITLMFVGGYSAYREFIRRQVLVSASDQLKSNLDLARQRALTVEKPATCLGPLTGYEVTFTQTTYSIRPECGGGPGPDYTLIYSLPNSVTITTSGFVTPLIYKSTGGTNLASNATVTLTHSSGEKRILTVNPQGIVQ